MRDRKCEMPIQIDKRRQLLFFQFVMMSVATREMFINCLLHQKINERVSKSRFKLVTLKRENNYHKNGLMQNQY